MKPLVIIAAAAITNAAIVEGIAPAEFTVTGLAKAPPYSWAEQEQSLGLPQ